MPSWQVSLHLNILHLKHTYVVVVTEQTRVVLYFSLEKLGREEAGSFMSSSKKGMYCIMREPSEGYQDREVGYCQS